MGQEGFRAKVRVTANSHPQLPTSLMVIGIYQKTSQEAALLKAERVVFQHSSGFTRCWLSNHWQGFTGLVQSITHIMTHWIPMLYRKHYAQNKIKWYLMNSMEQSLSLEACSCSASEEILTLSIMYSQRLYHKTISWATWIHSKPSTMQHLNLQIVS